MKNFSLYKNWLAKQMSLLPKDRVTDEIWHEDIMKQKGIRII